MNKILIICSILCVVLAGCGDNKVVENDNSQAPVVDIQNIPEDNNKQNKPEENKIENVALDSEYGMAIESCFHNTRVSDEVYHGCMAEFDSVKDAPKEYLAACATSRAMHNDKSEDIYQAKVPFSVFNKALIELFGEEADGLITEKDLETVFYVQKNEDGETYHFNGWGPSDTQYAACFIKNITKQNDILTAEIVEYRVTYSESSYDMEEGKDYNITISNMDSKEAKTLTIRLDSDAEKSGTFDEAGNKINSLDDYVNENLLDKVSIRTINYKYNDSDGTAIMLGNSLNK